MSDDAQRRLPLLAAGLATFGLMGFGQSLIGPALPEMTRKFALADGQAAMLVSAQWIGSAVGVGVMYVAADRIVPRHALAFLVLGGAGLALQPMWGLVLLAALVFGIGYGMATASFNPRVLKLFGGRGASMLSLLNAAFAAGAIVAPLVFVWLGSRSALVFALLAGACVVVWLLAAEPARQDAAAVSGAARPGYRLHWPILGFGVVSIGIEASLIGLGPTALIAAGATEARAAQYLSAFFVVFLAARVVLGVMAHRVPSFAIYIAGMAWALVCALAAVLGLPGMAFVAMGISAGMFFPSYYVTAVRKMGEDPRVTPLVLAAGLVGGIGMPVVLAFGMGGFGDRGFFVLLAALALPSLLAALALRRGMNG